MSDKFVSSYSYKLIYVFRINDKAHEGLLKIGDATLKTDESIDRLSPNCRLLNQAAKERINSYTNTAGVTYDLLHTELAVRTDIKKGTIKAFRDHDVHAVLEHSGIEKIVLKGTKAREWFRVDLDTVKRAIEAVKQFRPTLNPSETGVPFTPIVFRPEQLQAISETIKQFKTGDRMLWNAKMRFGKTLSALEVVRQMKFGKTIIVTHRPVVDNGWYEDFGKIFYFEEDYVYGSKNNNYTIDRLLSSGKKFIYFASIQDLRGSDKVGGKFDKNNEVFNTEWDCVIVDEAHEGTTTALGEEVIKAIVSEKTKFLALSGTPFNILGSYDKNVYTWDYIMEQRCKAQWDSEHFGDSNPYDELPKMNIFVYDLGKLLGNRYVELEDKAFNFHEFFRTWTGDIRRDFKPMPDGATVGDFVHDEDVTSFLNLITKDDPDSQYPFATEKYRKLFKHSLWMVPGVSAAKALSKKLKDHPVFGYFKVVNVAGDGDEEEKSDKALKMVNDAIAAAGEDGYTITLSCGRLTTGVTVKEWNAVFMLAGTFSTSASSYLQTIFRVQSPCNKNGKIKDNCYVFDFAPDRTLKMVAESVALSTKAGKASESDKKIMGEFLNYCPVIAINGTNMREYSTNRLLQQLKKAYADRAVSNGFDDNNLYNDELLKLTDLELKQFESLKGIIGSSKAQQKTKEVDINKTGLTDEEYAEQEQLEKKPKKERTPEEQARLDELKEKKKNRSNAISILRGISVRMPLLIYGADIPIDEDFTLDKFLDDSIVDEASWAEFMPSGVTREVFRQFMKYYDQDIFVAAGRKIRNTVVGADDLAPTERVQQIARLFACFKNPDKETVLTPFRVVNMHLSDCLGGYSFYEENPPVNAEMLEQPRFVDRGQVTADTLANPHAQILEINSKTGLYPLFVVYSIFRARCDEYAENELTLEKQNELWAKTVQENIFVICKTPMAKFITKRTLVGYRNISINAHYFDDLINTMQNKQRQFVDRVLKPSYWHRSGDLMKFDAVVGNPPYQEMDGGNGASASPVYQYFVQQAQDVSSRYVSMIMPARWFVGGKGLDAFRNKMLKDDRIAYLCDFPNVNDVFPSVDIAGGVCYFLWDRKHKNICQVVNCDGTYRDLMTRQLDEYDIFVRSNKAIGIIQKVLSHHQGKYMDERVSPSKPFGLRTYYKPKENGIPCQFIQKIGLQYADPKDVKDEWNLLDKWKMLVPRSPIAGQTDFTKPVGFYYDGNSKIVPPGTCCTESFIVVCAAESKEEVEAFKTYLFTKTVRFLLLQCVASQDVIRDRYRFVPDLGTYSGVYTDEILCDLWGITEDEWNYIDSRIYNIKG